MNSPAHPDRQPMSVPPHCLYIRYKINRVRKLICTTSDTLKFSVIKNDGMDYLQYHHKTFEMHCFVGGFGGIRNQPSIRLFLNLMIHSISDLISPKNWLVLYFSGDIR